MILSFLKDGSSFRYFITQGMGQSSMFLTFALYLILGGGLRLWVGWEVGKEESQGSFIPVYYEACLKTQPAHKPLITRFFSSKRVVFVFSINHLTVGSFSINSFNSRLQKYSITTIHHDEKHDFFFYLVQCLSA